MPVLLRKRWTVTIAGIVMIGTFVAVALGSSGVWFHVDESRHRYPRRRRQCEPRRDQVRTNHSTDVRVQKIVFAPGAYSGWHHHPGIVIATVESGAVTFTNADCGSTTYGPGLAAGSVFIEADDEPGQASNVGGATVYATFVAPHADPPVFRIEDDPPDCH